MANANGGYTGLLLAVDLSKGKVKDFPLPEYSGEYIGGSGLACRMLYDLLDFSVDPLSPESPLLVMTGPLTGTKAPTSGRFVVCGRSPLTNIWGESNSGGFFGPEIKFAGYDGIIIRGAAADATTLVLDDGAATLRSAVHLWGEGSVETMRALRADLGKEYRIACIGQAGENLVKYAAVMNDEQRAAGRCGFGAAMGAKKLKALAVRGSKKAPLAHAEVFDNAAK